MVHNLVHKIVIDEQRLESFVNSEIEEILNFPLDWNSLSKKNILITGATGQIGKYLVKTLCQLGNSNLYAQSRSIKKLERTFKNEINTDSNNLHLIEHDLTMKFDTNVKYDIIFHTAGVTARREFERNPLNAYNSHVTSSINCLEYIKTVNPECAFVPISSESVYGTINGEIEDNQYGQLDILSKSDVYPNCRRNVELLCLVYGCKSYLPRLPRIFSPYILTLEGDGGFMTYTVDSLVNGRDIIIQKPNQIINIAVLKDIIINLFQIVIYGKPLTPYNLIYPFNRLSTYDIATLFKESLKSNINILKGDDVNEYGFFANNQSLKELTTHTHTHKC